MEGLEFCINQKIEFINEEGQLGISTVGEWAEEYFLVSVPLKEYQRRLLHAGDIVTGIYYDVDQKLYMFNSRVLERIVENIPMYKLSKPENLTSIQRRNYVRISLIIPVKYVEVTPNLKSLIDNEKLWEKNAVDIPWEKGTIFDISGGGINLGTSWPLELGKLILSNIHTEGLQIRVLGKVVRNYTRILNNQVTYHHGIKFVELRESDRDRIIGFIFKKFRQMKHEGV